MKASEIRVGRVYEGMSGYRRRLIALEKQPGRKLKVVTEGADGKIYRRSWEHFVRWSVREVKDAAQD